MDVVVALATPVAAILTSLAGICIAYLSYKSRKDAEAARKIADENQAELIVIKGLVFKVGDNVDGRLTQLLDAARAQGITDSDLARAEGFTAGEQQQRERGKK